MLKNLIKLFKDEEGATALEYGLMAAAVAGVLIIAAYFLGGRVSNQAVRMFPAMPQRAAENRLTVPAPITPPLIAWVVEIGKPRKVETRITTAPALCAENAWAASILMIRAPFISSMRQPPSLCVAAPSGAYNSRLAATPMA